MTKIKICGITNHKDAEAAATFGADALGFVFYPESPRYVDKKIVKEICLSMPPFITTVGVFVNEKPEVINSIAEFYKLDVVQLHGDEPPELCNAIHKKIIKAFRVKGRNIIEDIKKYDLHAALLDTYTEGSYGGTGKSFDWSIVSELQEKHSRIILSGGLNCDNVLLALKQANPYAVDVSTGVEDSKGKKDTIKIKRFIELVKSSNW